MIRKIIVILFVAFSVLSACGRGDPAHRAVNDFTKALADSSYEVAWEMLTPASRQRYDSTVVILHRFGWVEACQAVENLTGEITEEEFAELTGQELFARMAVTSEEVHNLSRRIRSVSYPSDSLAVVVLGTDEGLQEVVIRQIGESWLIDLASLGPPVRGE